MIVHGAIAPPRTVLEELLNEVLSIKCVPEVEQQKRGLLRRRASSEAPVVAESVLDPMPVDALRLGIAGFGNLTNGDALRLAEALRSAAAEWTPPRVFFAGIAYSSEDRRFWATLDGDVEGLTAVARGVGTSVERLRLFVDRRRFRPAIDLGTAAMSASRGDIVRVVNRLRTFRGQEWLVDTVTLTTQTFDGPRGDEKPFEHIRVGHSG